jgi:hypothetical protein
MGYMDFNNVRYVDVRHCDMYYFPPKAERDFYVLPSDAALRADALTLKTGD